MKLHSIDCGNMMVDGGALFGVIPKTMWIKKYNCDENNLCNITMRSLLIETDDRKILIDSGTGTKQDDKFFKYHYLNGEGELIKSLKEKGFSAEDITDVVHTHLHFDHCGGTLTKNNKGEIVSAFPNAKLWVSKIQWEWATKPNKREAPAYPQENILPMANTGNLHFIHEEGELFPGFYMLLANGHTRGQIIPVINYHGKKLVYCADLIPTMANVTLSFISAYDLFQLDVMYEKEELLNAAAENDMILFFEHDIQTECCSLQKNEKGIFAKKAISLDEFTKV
ncbi:MAG: MBL fold metallo-hydrolase [Salinivirgaceae bacterium]|jgi:glyoxylase-like metal-dependent hydrolase (beta-lactamase superfamily II)|nr:MBL fold metallo-hydrolase [Salinivirgaceae bacterium]